VCVRIMYTRVAMKEKRRKNKTAMRKDERKLIGRGACAWAWATIYIRNDLKKIIYERHDSKNKKKIEKKQQIIKTKRRMAEKAKLFTQRNGFLCSRMKSSRFYRPRKKEEREASGTSFCLPSLVERTQKLKARFDARNNARWN
jgi:hypothetical protein